MPPVDKGILAAFRRISERLRNQEYLFAALFFVVVIAALGTVPQLETGFWTSFIVLALVGFAFAAWILAIQSRQHQRRVQDVAPHARAVRAGRNSILLGMSLIFAATIFALERGGAFVSIIPMFYPERNAERLVAEYVSALDQLVHAGSDDEYVSAFVRYCDTLTIPYRQDHLKKVLKRDIPIEQLLTTWKQTHEAIPELVAAAKDYRALYSSIRGANLEAVRRESWRPIIKLGDRRQTYFVAVVSYTGNFHLNDLTSQPISLEEFLQPFSDPESWNRSRVGTMIRTHFPEADPASTQEALLKFDVRELFEANAIDLLGFRLRTALGERDRARMVQGFEIVTYSLMLETDPSSGGWRVGGFGKERTTTRFKIN